MAGDKCCPVAGNGDPQVAPKSSSPQIKAMGVGAEGGTRKLWPESTTRTGNRRLPHGMGQSPSLLDLGASQGAASAFQGPKGPSHPCSPPPRVLGQSALPGELAPSLSHVQDPHTPPWRPSPNPLLRGSAG